MKREQIISGKFRIKRILYYDDESYWGSYGMEIVELDEDSSKPVMNKYGNMTFVGELSHPAQSSVVECSAELVEHPKYGLQYQIRSVKMDIDINNPDSQRAYLEAIFTSLEVVRMYDVLEDPFKSFMDKDVKALIQVKGFGPRTIWDKIDKFHDKLGIAMMVSELKDFNLTLGMCSRILDRYHNAELAVKVLKENPYRLIRDLDGVGFKRADAIALKSGIEPFSVKRVSAFMYYYMEAQGQNGDSWITPEELLGAVHENLGSDIPALVVTDSIHEMQDNGDIWCDDDHTMIGLYKYYRIEEELAENLIRLRDADNLFEYDDFDAAIKRQEETQGWEFEPEQIFGIKACLENNVIYITGGAGTGKSSTVGGMLSVFKGKYSFAQCALAGRAASRLAEITGKDGFTIHKLLEASGDGSFGRNKFNPLQEDIIIVDEVSMISVDLMLRLVEAMKDGSKLIMLGDSNQLESIGCGNFAHDIMNSEEIITIHLTKIHRQAQKSGIVTSSVAVAQGTQLFNKGFVGKETRGQLEDFHIDAYEDKGHTFYAITQHVNVLLENGIPKQDIEVIVPMKERGDSSVYNLNQTLQDLLNPSTAENDNLMDNQKVTSYIAKDKAYTFRIGDRVINRVNNYDTIPEIYNGNIGEVMEITGKNEEFPMTVYFFGLGMVKIPRSAINNIHLAYAITCHSAQGSEFNNVIVGLDFNSYALLTRQWVYTAITRAKKDCILCCESNALRYAISQNFVVNKHTHLERCLFEQTHYII